MSERKLGQEIQDLPHNRDVPGLSERLSRAVERAGGAAAVARKSGVPLRTLNHYLAGTGLKVGTLVALADACGVSVDWLATGREPAGDGRAAAPAEVTRSIEPPSTGLFGMVKGDELDAAIDDALAMLADRGKVLEPHAFVRIVLLTYDREEIIMPGGVP